MSEYLNQLKAQSERDSEKAELALVMVELDEAKSETAVPQILQENQESVERQKVGGFFPIFHPFLLFPV